VRRSVTIAANELRILKRDPAWIVLLFVIPLILVGLMRGGVHFILALTGHPAASGADFSVPAQAVTFVFYLPGLIGISFLREHGWATWGRLRATGTPTAHILIGKVLPIAIMGICQMAIIFGIGESFYGLHIRGSTAGVALVACVLVLTVITMGLAITVLVRTMQQLNAVANITPVALGALGGALMPLVTLPAWVHRVAPATPQYWAMRAFDQLILDGGNLWTAVLPMAVLLLYAVAFAVVALLGLRATERRLAFA
jgi:ABC-2 type transport system permease protein